MARAEAERAPAALPSVVVSANRATLRDRIADTVTPFLANFSDEEAARINAAEVADALLAVLPAPAPVCICGHSKQQHFEDACITEITGCNCGDYLEPQDAAEVIDRWRQAALHARATNRATLLREAADDEEGDELACVDECGSCDACGMEPFGTPAEGWREAARFLRRTARDSTDRQGALHGARLIEAELRRVAVEEQPAETQAEHVCKPGAGTYFCPASGQTESDCHGGFDVCCDRPELHRPAVVEQPTETQDCGRTKSVDGTEYPPCARPAGHEEAYCRSADGNAYFLAMDGHRPAARPAVAEQPDTQTREAGPRIPCNWARTRTEHLPHGWEPQPGMDPVHCPGYPQPAP
jgi:hypothetical protein